MVQSLDNFLQSPVGWLLPLADGCVRGLGHYLHHGKYRLEQTGDGPTSFTPPTISFGASISILKAIEPAIDPDIKILGSILTMAKNILSYAVRIRVSRALSLIAIIGIHSGR